MDTKKVDAFNKSRNIRLLALKEIFEEHTDAEHSITMEGLREKLKEYGITSERRTNYGVIRSSITGEILRMALNFDNNQAYLSNPGGHYSSGMLRSFEKMYGLTEEDTNDLQALLNECRNRIFLKAVCDVGTEFLLSRI